jgi:N-hydroxyarylamine O-acetyltransferase
MLTDLQLEQYFRRIGLVRKASADPETLKILHLLHPQSIPFENIDSWSGTRVTIDTDAVFNKLVNDQRGGYCYEHNWLFMQVLQSIGFRVTGLAARVHWMQPPGFVPPRTHMALLVETDGTRFLADVGFGGQTMTAPLLLDEAGPQATPNETLLLAIRDDGSYLLSTSMKEMWHPMFSFTLEPQQLPDYQQANWFVSTHPESRFVCNLVAARVEGQHRHALMNNRYTVHHPGRNSVVTELRTPLELRRLLEQTFGIDTGKLDDLDAGLTGLFPVS